MNLKRLVQLLSHANVFVYGCSWLLVLVVIGTLAQPAEGLFHAQERYFSSWWFQLGYLPLPGGRLTLTVIFVNLLLFLLTRQSWRLNKSGVIIMHLGGLLLLFGGFITAYFSQESTMVIDEGETTAFVQQDRQLELAVIDQSQADRDRLTTYAPGWFVAGELLQPEVFPGAIEIVEYFDNCVTIKRASAAPADARGLFAEYEIIERPRTGRFEDNRRVLLVQVRGAGPEADGRYALLESMPEPQRFAAGGKSYGLDLRGRRMRLPFSLELLDFEKQIHPGTNTPRSFKSVVHLHEEESRQRVVIQMNEPLRHRGYTFFQSSFIEGATRDTTVLAVVKNYGRLFPYVSSLIMCIGLLIHLLLQLPRLLRTQTAKA